MPERKVHLAELSREYDRLSEMLEAARPASGSKDDMLAATAGMRRVSDAARVLLETVAVETYDQAAHADGQPPVSHTDMGAALGTFGRTADPAAPMARNNAQRWIEMARDRLPQAREAEGLSARLGA